MKTRRIIIIAALGLIAAEKFLTTILSVHSDNGTGPTFWENMQNRSFSMNSILTGIYAGTIGLLAFFTSPKGIIVLIVCALAFFWRQRPTKVQP